MKLCDIAQFYSPLSGGVKRYISEKSLFFGTLPDIRHIIIVPAPRDNVIEEGHTVVYQVKSPPLPFSRSYRVLCSEKRIETIIDAEKPDIIEVGDPYRAAWIGIRQARRMGIPISGYYHSDYPRAYSRSARKYLGRSIAEMLAPRIDKYLVNLYRQMDATIVASRRMEGILANMGIDNLVRIPPGIDTDIFAPSPQRTRIRASLGIEADRRLLLYVGRLAREKNIHKLLRAHDILSQSMQCHLHIVGDGEMRRAVTRHLRTRRNSTWLPYCADKARLAEIYSAADLLIHPGTEETFGLVSIEAQACGLPVLGVRGGGIDETIPDCDRPKMSPSCEPRDLAQAAELILANRTHTSAADKLQARARRLFSLETSSTRLLELYRELVAARQGGES